jgi:hypothetical protein
MRNTTFPPSPPASPPQKHKELPVRSFIPTDDQIHEAIGRAKLGMGRNQDSTAKVGAASRTFVADIAGVELDTRHRTYLGSHGEEVSKGRPGSSKSTEFPTITTC